MEDKNARDIAILKMVAGQLTNTELSRRWGVSCARVSQLKVELGRQVKLRWGGGRARLATRLRTDRARTQCLPPCAAGLKEGRLRG
jgi:hypothetical protein